MPDQGVCSLRCWLRGDLELIDKLRPNRKHRRLAVRWDDSLVLGQIPPSFTTNSRGSLRPVPSRLCLSKSCERPFLSRPNS
nr:MAG: hypothetical protein DIU78_08335 [Pseudomonadota bacterium]